MDVCLQTKLKVCPSRILVGRDENYVVEVDVRLHLLLFENFHPHCRLLLNQQRFSRLRPYFLHRLYHARVVQLMLFLLGHSNHLLPLLLCYCLYLLFMLLLWNLLCLFRLCNDLSANINSSFFFILWLRRAGRVLVRRRRLVVFPSLLKVF